jgi:hypothetical protein
MRMSSASSYGRDLVDVSDSKTLSTISISNKYVHNNMNASI